MREGANGYLLKDLAVQDLVAAIESVMTGGSFFSERAQRALANSLRAGDPEDAPLNDEWFLDLSGNTPTLSVTPNQYGWRQTGDLFDLVPHLLLQVRRHPKCMQVGFPDDVRQSDRRRPAQPGG